MKKIVKYIQYIFGLLAMIMLPGTYGCLKDAPYLEPEPLYEPTTVGVRLQVDSIVCLSDWDDTGGDDNVELYGFIRSFATYEYPVASPPDHYEKKDTALLWYRDAKKSNEYPGQWVRLYNTEVIRLNPPDPNGDVIVERGYVDYYCDINKTHQCRIHIFPFLMDWDENSWNPQLDDDLYRVRTDLLDNKTSWTVEELLAQEGKRRISLKVPDYGNDPLLIKGEIVIHLSIQIITEYDVTYPEGKGPDMEFKEAEHIVPDPPRSASMYLPPSSTSQRLVAAQVPAQVLALSPMSATIDGIKYSVYNYRPDFLSLSLPITPVFESRNLDPCHDKGAEKWVGLVRNDALRDIYYRKPFREDNGARTGDVLLKSKPYLQLIKYWRLVDSQQIPKGKIQKVGWETKVGISRTYGHELSITTGIGGSGIFDIFSFNLEVKNTFSSSYTYQLEETVSTEDVYGPYDVEVRCNIWQEMHEFRVVDEYGKLFSDPNYEFKSVVVATVPVNNFYEDIQEFE